MKIAIVTIYDGNNFGSFLQAYALMKKMEDMGHEVVFVERMPQEEVLPYYLKVRISKNRGRLLNFIADIKRSIFNRAGDEMRRNDIRKIYPYLRDARKELSIVDVHNLDDVDLIICGSDEIWNFQNASVDVPFYTCLNYGDGIRKVSYAISVGISTEEDFIQHHDVIKQIMKFELLLARDEITEKVLSTITGKKIDKVCDPTLLIDKWQFVKKRRTIINEKYMLLYAYSMSMEQERIVKSYARLKGLKIIAVCNYLRVADEVVQVSPFDFPNLIMDAECCFTSTFHGTIFCSLFAEKYCIFPRRPKVMDVVKLIGIEDYLWNGKDAERFMSLMENSVNRTMIDNNIRAVRYQSEKIIKEQLF